MTARDQSDLVWDTSAQIDSTGSANAYLITTAQPLTGYIRGMSPIRFKANFGNTGSATVNVNGLGAVTLKKQGGAADLASGDIVSGGVYTLVYDGAAFQVQELNSAIAAGTITNAMLANMAEATIKGRAAGAGTGAPQDLTPAQARTAIAAANIAGDTFTGLVTLSAGNATSSTDFLRLRPTDYGANKPELAFLKSVTAETWHIVLTDGSDNNGTINLTSQNLTHNSLKLGAPLVSGSVSSAATLDLVLTAYTGYRTLQLVLENFVPATDDVDLWLRFSTDGGSSFDATGYGYGITGINDNNDINTLNSTSAAQIVITGNAAATHSVSNVASEGGASAVIDLFGRTAAAFTRALIRSGHHAANGTRNSGFTGNGVREAAQDTDAIRIMFESGNIASGNYALYGRL